MLRRVLLVGEPQLQRVSKRCRHGQPGRQGVSANSSCRRGRCIIPPDWPARSLRTCYTAVPPPAIRVPLPLPASPSGLPGHLPTPATTAARWCRRPWNLCGVWCVWGVRGACWAATLHPSWQDTTWQLRPQGIDPPFIPVGSQRQLIFLLIVVAPCIHSVVILHALELLALAPALQHCCLQGGERDGLGEGRFVWLVWQDRPNCSTLPHAQLICPAHRLHRRHPPSILKPPTTQREQKSLPPYRHFDALGKSP